MTTKTKPVLTLVVSDSDLLQDGLLALLTTISQIGAVLVAEDIDSARQTVENHQPSLIIMDTSLLQVHVVIAEIKTEHPNIHLIVLVEDIDQQKEVEALGADNVLIKGFPAQKLIDVVENIIDCQEDTPFVQMNTGRDMISNE